MSTVLYNDVQRQGFGEQVGNLIIGIDRENFHFPMMYMLTKMMVTNKDIHCARSEFGEPFKLYDTCISLKHLTNT